MHSFVVARIATTIFVFMHRNRNFSMSRGMMSSNVSIGLLFVEALCEAAHARPHTRGRRAPLSVVTGRLRGERGHVQRVVLFVKFCFKSIVAHANFQTKIRVARLRLFVLISLRPARGQEEGEGHGIPCVDHEATSVHAMVVRQRCRQDGPSFPEDALG